MTVSIVATGDTSCNLIETTVSSSAVFPIPLGKPALVAALRQLLSDPECNLVESGAVRIDRYRDGPRVHVGSGNFLVRYKDACPLVLE
ncbi:MAG: hypothetical protein IH625_14155 [Rhodobacteraceae bacterium]|nr:hypothetical protein [Paracoccaceae bacterium]